MANSDSGIYHVIYRVSRAFSVRVGAAGAYEFREGYYVYTGTAQRALRARIERHARREKKARWHIDYFSSHSGAEFVAAYFFAGEPASRECRRNLRLVAAASFYIPKFGCSDCGAGCPSHLAGFRSLEEIVAAIGPGGVLYGGTVTRF